jgi:hypothetical protein
LWGAIQWLSGTPPLFPISLLEPLFLASSMKSLLLILQCGIVIIGVKDAVHEIVGVPDNRIGETLDVPLRAPGKWTSLFRRTIHHRRNGASPPA